MLSDKNTDKIIILNLFVIFQEEKERSIKEYVKVYIKENDGKRKTENRGGDVIVQVKQKWSTKVVANSKQFDEKASRKNKNNLFIIIQGMFGK